MASVRTPRWRGSWCSWIAVFARVVADALERLPGDAQDHDGDRQGDDREPTRGRNEDRAGPRVSWRVQRARMSIAQCPHGSQRATAVTR